MQLLMRAHSCKQPALLMATFLNFRGGRLRELQLYVKQETVKHQYSEKAHHVLSRQNCDFSTVSPKKDFTRQFRKNNETY